MCGICGFSGELVENLGIKSLKEMLGSLIHRGPDDDGIYFNKLIGFGMRRLSIIDLNNGHQPIHNENKNIWTIFNGEIYNYKFLKNFLQIRGHKFYTNTDTEVIVHLYEEYGEDFIQHLSGVFAIALWDNNLNKLILVRDRLGVKPLYYTIKNNTIIFASEIKSILCCSAVERAINNKIMGSYLTFRYIPGEQTLFKNIYKLMPGNSLVFVNNKIRIKQFWNVDFNVGFNEKPEIYYEDNIRSLLQTAIQDRLMSDVPIGVFLSGGLDSSIVLALASKLSSEKLKTFSVAFSKPSAKTSLSEFNELNYAKRVADFYGSEHYEYTIDTKEVIDDLNDIIWYLDEPLGDPTAIPLYYVSRLSKNYSKVVLSGEGADEIFAGYEIYREPNLISKYNNIPYFIRKGFIEPLVTKMPFKFGKDFLRRTEMNICSRYRGVGRTFREDEILSLLNLDFCESITNSLVEDYISSIYRATELGDDINRMLYFDQKVWLPEDVLMKSDKITMANSIELRVPFLDYRLVQFASNIPSKLKYKGKCEKYILKQAFADILPDFVLKRQKNGFPVPITSLLNSDYKNFAQDILLSSSSINRGYFNKSYIENLFNTNSTRNPYASRQIWLLLTFELWNKLYVDNFNTNANTPSIIEQTS